MTLRHGFNLPLFLPAAAALLFSGGGLFALTPPLPSDIAALRTSGKLAESVAFAKQLGHNIISGAPRSAQSGGRPLSGATPAVWRHLPSTGTVNILVVPIKFTNTSAHYTQAELTERYEELTDFYRQSSFGKLNLNITVLPWYTYNGTQSSLPRTPAGRQTVITAALAARDGSVDYSQFDNDGDGDLDLIITLWAGARGDWSTFWWPYQTTYETPSSLDGVALRAYIWQWEYCPALAEPGPVAVSKHEVGHALGLPDYYDYDTGIGPGGGLGGGDMMDDSTADHNAFSKFLLGWLTPQVYTNGTNAVTLDAGQAVQAGPTAEPGKAWDEYYLAEYRQKNGIDSALPASGLYLWRVNARPEPSGAVFHNDNSFTRQKLLSRVEADGNDSIETTLAPVSAASVYSNGNIFSPATTPASRDFRNKDTGLTLGPVTLGENLCTLPVTIATAPAATDLAAAVGAADGQAILTWTAPAPGSYYLSYSTKPAAANFFAAGTLPDGWSTVSSNDRAGNWSISSATAQSGSIARESGYGYSVLQTTITGPAALTFQWRTSSEQNGDYLVFLLDGTPLYSLSGETDWSTVTYAIPAGDHELEWEYSKNAANSSADDKGYLRNIYLTAAPAIDWTTAVTIATFTATAAGQALSHTAENLPTSGACYFALKSKNAAGAASDTSNTAALVLAAGPKLSAISSPSHGVENVWSNQSAASFTWTAENAAGFYISFSSVPAMTTAALRAVGVFTTGTSTAAAMADGQWYFHLAAAHADGRLTAVTTIPLRVDTAPPLATLALPQTTLASGRAELTLTLTDLSGEAAMPVLTYTAGGSTITVTLAGADGAYTGVFFIQSYDRAGPAVFSFHAADKAGNFTTVLQGTSTFIIDTALSGQAGGTAANADGTAVFVPAGATPSTITVRMETVSDADTAIAAANNLLNPSGGPAPLNGLNCSRRFTAETSTGTRLEAFASPVRISVPYPDANADGVVDATAIRVSALGLYYLDPVHGWAAVPGAYADTANHALSGWVNHFSIYGLLATPETSGFPADVIVYPQPCRFKTDGKITFAPLPQDAGLTVRIYTLNGSLVRTLTEAGGITGSGSGKRAEWDGRNSSGEKVASGMYLYVIKAQSGTRTGHLAALW